EIWLVLFLARLAQLLRPWQQRELAGLEPAVLFAVVVGAAADPGARQVRMTVRKPRHRALGDVWWSKRSEFAGEACRKTFLLGWLAGRLLRQQRHRKRDDDDRRDSHVSHGRSSVVHVEPTLSGRPD